MNQHLIVEQPSQEEQIRQQQLEQEHTLLFEQLNQVQLAVVEKIQVERQLEAQISKLDTNYKGMLAREKRYKQQKEQYEKAQKKFLVRIAQAEEKNASLLAQLNQLHLDIDKAEQKKKYMTDQFSALERKFHGMADRQNRSKQQIAKMTLNYEGMLVREKNYKNKIAKLEKALQAEKEKMKSGLSYRLESLVGESKKPIDKLLNLSGKAVNLTRERFSGNKADEE